MNNTIRILFASLSYDNLKFATLLIAGGTLGMLKLSSLAAVSPFSIMPFDDVLSSDSNIFFTYFLDFSGVLSSILLVGIIIFFMIFQLIMMSSYMNDRSKKWLILVLIAGLGVYGWVSTIHPIIEKFENQFFTSFKVGSKVYSNQYQEAYGIVASEKISPIDKAYMNAQISADQFKQYPTRDNEMLLKADTMQLETVIKKNDGNTGKMDENVLYKIYQLSKDKGEFKELAILSKRLDQKAYLYSFLIALLYVSALYNIYIYRSKNGM